MGNRDAPRTGVQLISAPRHGAWRLWPTLVMPKCGKLKAFTPCVVGHFMSNIKDVPNGHASRLAVRAKQDSRRQDSLNIDSLNKSFSNSIPADVRFGLPVADV